jgi:hypothetical protein
MSTSTDETEQQMAIQSCVAYGKANDIMKLVLEGKLTNFRHFRRTYSDGVMTQFVFEFEGTTDQYRLRCDEIWSPYVQKKYRETKDDTEFYEWLKPRVFAYLAANPDERVMIDGEPRPKVPEPVTVTYREGDCWSVREVTPFNRTGVLNDLEATEEDLKEEGGAREGEITVDHLDNGITIITYFNSDGESRNWIADTLFYTE